MIKNKLFITFAILFFSLFTSSLAIAQNNNALTLEEFAKEAGISSEKAKKAYEMFCAGATVTVNGIKFNPATYGIKKDIGKMQELAEKQKKETEARIEEERRIEEKREAEIRAAEEREALKRRQEAQSSQQSSATKELDNSIPPKAREWTVEDTLPAAGTRRWHCKLYSDGTCTVRRGGKEYEGTWTYKHYNEFKDLITIRYDGRRLSVSYDIQHEYVSYYSD